MKKSLIVSTIIHVLVFGLVFFMPRSSTRWDRADAIPVQLVSSMNVRAKAATPAPPAPPPVEASAPEVADPAPKEPEKTAEPKAKVPKDAKPKSKETKPAAKDKSRPSDARRFQKLDTPSEDEPSLEERVRQRLENPSAGESTPSPSSQATGATSSGDVTGTAEVEATDFPYAWYLNLLRTKISDAWDPPASRLVAGRTNQVIIHFRLARDGSVSDVDVDVVSGAPGLDSSARRAVDRAQPFPPLPSGFAEDSVEISVRFKVSEG